MLALAKRSSRIHRQDGGLRPRERGHEGHAGVAARGPVGQGQGAVRTGLSACHRQRKMLRNFVQIMRSGAVGRKSLGSLPKRMIREWFEDADAEQIFNSRSGSRRRSRTS